MSFLGTAFNGLDESFQQIVICSGAIHRRLRDVPLIESDLRLPCGVSACRFTRQEINLAGDVTAFPELGLRGDFDEEITSHIRSDGALSCTCAIFRQSRQFQVVPVQLRVRHPTQIWIRRGC